MSPTTRTLSILTGPHPRGRPRSPRQAAARSSARRPSPRAGRGPPALAQRGSGGCVLIDAFQYAITGCRTGVIAYNWAISHKSWNKYMHALHGNTVGTRSTAARDAETHPAQEPHQAQEPQQAQEPHPAQEPQQAQEPPPVQEPHLAQEPEPQAQEPPPAQEPLQAQGPSQAQQLPTLDRDQPPTQDRDRESQPQEAPQAQEPPQLALPPPELKGRR
ncbi:hypothetical protein EMIHUDRAFT_233572 [Emiliania huxleyi CCMP1516]|uniref:Uncharacterized protein n=2 Tax=Emiliania huxleyi TaxID=2903 RepID=A0A0D3K1Q5_EMIH1|nr:hypothetical protein EMIHUDRAFT_233572 [Emiliania huxleyi CCMP1516]EOD29690.1 hypothetical protein EMIHUDRAFT_233572 [Emiliania huxleyi CCMP1516]|eukprot:XP_005782119.1 hypothetical protein EMIHUDRAFT_233572 [Emiliania huxleyi CCMP1516]